MSAARVPACARSRHSWIVGQVWGGSSGGVIIPETCLHCGMTRTTDTRHATRVTYQASDSDVWVWPDADTSSAWDD